MISFSLKEDISCFGVRSIIVIRWTFSELLLKIVLWEVLLWYHHRKSHSIHWFLRRNRFDMLSPLTSLSFWTDHTMIYTIVHKIAFWHKITFRPRIWHFQFAQISRRIGIKSRYTLKTSWWVQVWMNFVFNREISRCRGMKKKPDIINTLEIFDLSKDHPNCGRDWLLQDHCPCIRGVDIANWSQICLALFEIKSLTLTWMIWRKCGWESSRNRHWTAAWRELRKLIEEGAKVGRFDDGAAGDEFKELARNEWAEFVRGKREINGMNGKHGVIESFQSKNSIHHCQELISQSIQTAWLSDSQYPLILMLLLPKRDLYQFQGSTTVCEWSHISLISDLKSSNCYIAKFTFVPAPANDVSPLFRQSQMYT
jgi:hypothetical protein